VPGKFYECEGGHKVLMPHPGPQTACLKSSAREVLYGGAAGPGKTYASCMLPLRWIEHPHLSVLVLRRQTTDLVELQNITRRMYPGTGGHIRMEGSGFTWSWPSGARIRFSHCNTVADAHGFDGQEFQIIVFDELVQFEQKQYRDVSARLRGSMSGLPRLIRSSTNPPDAGQGEWVFQHWGAWLDPSFKAPGLPTRTGQPPLGPGVVAWVVKSAVEDAPDVYIVDKGAADEWNKAPERSEDKNYALSRQFIPARLRDNPALTANDKEYARGLKDHDRVRRAQLEDGNWLIRPAPGDYFRRTWVGDYVELAPADCVRIRGWDRAATAEFDGKEPDWTVGVKLAFSPATLVYVEDVIRLRGTPGDIETRIKQAAKEDGPDVKQVISMDPGQAGKVEAWHLSKALVGFNFDFIREEGDKRTRFMPFSSWAKAGNVRIVAGHWNTVYLDELELFPVGKFDDQVDATSLAFWLMNDDAGEGGGAPVGHGGRDFDSTGLG